MSDFLNIHYRCNDGRTTGCDLSEEQKDRLPVLLDEVGIDGYVDIEHSMHQTGNLMQCDMRVSKNGHQLFPRGGFKGTHKTRIPYIKECPYSFCRETEVVNDEMQDEIQNDTVNECNESLISDLLESFTAQPYEPEEVKDVSYRYNGKGVSYLDFLGKNGFSGERKERIDGLIAKAQSLGEKVEIAIQRDRNSWEKEDILTYTIIVDGEKRCRAEENCVPFFPLFGNIAKKEDLEECADDVLSELEDQLSEEVAAHEEAELQSRIVPLHKSLADLGFGLSVLGLFGYAGLVAKHSFFAAPILVPTDLLESWGRPAGEDTA